MTRMHRLTRGCCLAVLGATSVAFGGERSYTITDLGPIIDGSESTKADAINNHGQVAGVSQGAGVNRTTLWLPEPFFGLPAGPNAIGPVNTGGDRAYGINDAGQVVGFVGNGLTGETRAYRWDPDDGLTDLGVLGGLRSIAHSINNAGLVVGESGSDEPGVFKRAFLWDGREMIDLGTFDEGAFESRAYDINEQGQIVGHSMYIDEGVDPDDSRLRACIWLSEPAYGLDAGMHDIDTLSFQRTQISTARGINDLGQVVCWGTNYGIHQYSTYVPFWLWLPEPAYGLPAGVNNLNGPYGGPSTAFAQDINDRGEVVFRANVNPNAVFGDWRAMVWHQGLWIDLIDCIPAEDREDWWFGSATDINDSGQICGWGWYRGEARGFMLTPVVPEFPCEADFGRDGRVDNNDLLSVLGRWGLCPDADPCSGDANRDGAVDTTDLMVVLSTWGECPGTVPGACCFGTGDCQDLNEVDCGFLGGKWQAGSCETVSCFQPPTGACCIYVTGQCLDTTEQLCTYVEGGVWQGPHTTCDTVVCDAPMTGDRVDKPYLIDAIPFSDIGFTTGFGDDYDSICPSGAFAPDVVYAWTATQDDHLRISLCGDTDYDSKVYVYENDESVTVACNDDFCTTPSYPDNPFVSRIDVVEVTAGNTYYIVIDGWGEESGKYTLDIDHVDVGACCLPSNECAIMTEDTCLAGMGIWNGPDSSCDPYPCGTPATGACCLGVSCIPGLTEYDCEVVFGGSWLGADTTCAAQSCELPPGDRIDNPIEIGTLPYATTGDTSGFLDWHDEACPIPSNAPEVVYAYTPAVDEVVTISLCGNSAFDTKLYVYEDVETPGAPYACNEDSCLTPSFPLFAFVSELSALPLTAGRTYFVVVDGFSMEAGFYTLDITVD